MPVPRRDLHIHTRHIGCANATMEIPAILAECARLGCETVAITDHLNRPDQLPTHELIRELLRMAKPPFEVFFGCELDFTGCDQGFCFSAEIKERYGFQFAIGGIHASYIEEYDLAKLLAIRHRHHLKVCADPLVNVLVHPYWFWMGEFIDHGWPWFKSMKDVPRSDIRELGQAAAESGTAIEINGTGIFNNDDYGATFQAEYEEFLHMLAAEGASFTVSSDAHDINALKHVETSWAVAERLNLPAERFWKPAGKAFNG